MINKIKSFNKYELIAFILIIVSLFNFCFFMYHSVKLAALQSNTFCCEMADDTEEDRIERQKLREQSELEIPKYEKIVEQSKPICLAVGLLSLIGIISMFIIDIRKRTKSNLFSFCIISFFYNMLLVLICLGG